MPIFTIVFNLIQIVLKLMQWVIQARHAYDNSTISNSARCCRPLRLCFHKYHCYTRQPRLSAGHEAVLSLPWFLVESDGRGGDHKQAYRYRLITSASPYQLAGCCSPPLTLAKARFDTNDTYQWANGSHGRADSHVKCNLQARLAPTPRSDHKTILTFFSALPSVIVTNDPVWTSQNFL